MLRNPSTAPLMQCLEKLLADVASKEVTAGGAVES